MAEENLPVNVTTVTTVDSKHIINPDTDKRIQIPLWRARQKMAWVALYGVFGATLLAMFLVDTERLKLLIEGEVMTWLYFTLGSIVVAYFGFKAWSLKGKSGLQVNNKDSDKE